MKGLNDIQALLDAFGGEYEEKEVTVRGVTRKFTFRRLSFLEADKIRVHSVGKEGTFDPDRHAGNNARLVSASLVDPDTHEMVAPVEEVELWPLPLVDALAKAAQAVNAATVEDQKELGKDSSSTPSAASS